MDGYHILHATKPFGWINVEVLCFGSANVKVRHAEFWPQTEVALSLLTGGETKVPLIMPISGLRLHFLFVQLLLITPDKKKSHL